MRLREGTFSSCMLLFCFVFFSFLVCVFGLHWLSMVEKKEEKKKVCALCHKILLHLCFQILMNLVQRCLTIFVESNGKRHTSNSMLQLCLFTFFFLALQLSTSLTLRFPSPSICLHVYLYLLICASVRANSYPFSHMHARKYLTLEPSKKKKNVSLRLRSVFSIKELRKKSIR